MNTQYHPSSAQGGRQGGEIDASIGWLTSSIDRFDKTGKMTTAIRPPEAFIPKRNGSDSFSSDSPPIYVNNGTGDDVSPADNPTGRDNNHGKPHSLVANATDLFFTRLRASD